MIPKILVSYKVCSIYMSCIFFVSFVLAPKKKIAKPHPDLRSKDKPQCESQWQTHKWDFWQFLIWQKIVNSKSFQKHINFLTVISLGKYFVWYAVKSFFEQSEVIVSNHPHLLLFEIFGKNQWGGSGRRSKSPYRKKKVSTVFCQKCLLLRGNSGG